MLLNIESNIFSNIDILKETLLIKNTNFKSLPKTKIKYYLNDENFKSTAIQNIFFIGNPIPRKINFFDLTNIIQNAQIKICQFVLT